MKDRVSTYPGRVRLTPVEGQANVYDLAWADEPQQTGTPLNKASLLSDAVAAALKIAGEDSTVNDAFAAISGGFCRIIEEGRAPTTDDVYKAGDIWVNTIGIPYIVYISLGLGVWLVVPTTGKEMITKIFTASTTWTKPANLTGGARVIVYGAGGAGYCSSGGAGASGGGGGRMAEYIGELDASSYVITVGKGGVGRSAAGGSSSFGTLVSAAGGSGGTSKNGGPGGSGGGGVTGGRGYEFGGGSGSIPGAGGTNKGTQTKGGNGVDTTGMGVPDNAKGDGTGGTTSTGFGGGGGFGGKGGNGQAQGCGGGGGYGPGGNGGDGNTSTATGGRGGDGGIGAGGGGSYYDGTQGNGGDGIVVIQYYTS